MVLAFFPAETSEDSLPSMFLSYLALRLFLTVWFHAAHPVPAVFCNYFYVVNSTAAFARRCWCHALEELSYLHDVDWLTVPLFLQGVWNLRDQPWKHWLRSAYVDHKNLCLQDLTFSTLPSLSFTPSDVFHTAFDTWKSDWDFAVWDSKLQEEATRLSQLENLPSDDYDKSDRQELPPTRSFQDDHPFDMFCDCLNCVSALSEIMDGGGVLDTDGVAYDGGEELCETEEDFMYDL